MFQPSRLTTTQRLYGAAHQRERERWRPLVDAGFCHCAQDICVEPTRWIQPGTPWHLGHNDDRTAYIGPVHATCNVKDGARRGNQRSNHQQHARRHGTTPQHWQSRTW